MKRKTVAVGAGFCFWVAPHLLRLLLTLFTVRRLGPSRFGSFTRSIDPIFTFFGFIVDPLAGLIAGWIAREKGWLYGGMVAMPIIILTWIAEMLKYFAPASIYVYGPKYANIYKPGLLFSYSFLKLLTRSLYSTGVTLLIFGLGGWIGEKLYKRRVSKQA